MHQQHFRLTGRPSKHEDSRAELRHRQFYITLVFPCRNE
jgi:hypothetical protein